jgi:hypothetical protein
MRRVIAIAASVWAAALVVTAGQPRAAYPGLLDSHPSIDYRGAPARDAITLLRSELAGVTGGLEFDPRLGYLQSLLQKLDVPVDSQILVFSKTGVQNAHTTPEHPRALYFNDHVIVGYIPGAPVIEIAAHDPRQGVIFQTLAQSPAPVVFARPDRCLSCHVSANSLEVPGILVRSNFTDSNGRAMPQLGSFLVDHRTPLEQRWGGWYVTGTHGSMRHLGNAFVTDPSDAASAVTTATLNRAALDPRVDTSLFPATTSDIVALMVFDHQGHAMNLLTRLAWETRVAAASDGSPDFTRGMLREVVDETVNYLLLRDEARLSDPVRGVSSFASTFPQRGPRDRRGRSLRDLDLRTRLFLYRCSYIIYSAAFDALPTPAKDAVYTRMRELITDPETRAILDDTKPEWKR